MKRSVIIILLTGPCEDNARVAAKFIAGTFMGHTVALSEDGTADRSDLDERILKLFDDLRSKNSTDLTVIYNIGNNIDHLLYLIDKESTKARGESVSLNLTTVRFYVGPAPAPHSCEERLRNCARDAWIDTTNACADDVRRKLKPLITKHIQPKIYRLRRI